MAYQPLFIGNPVTNNDESKWVPPDYFEENYNQRINDLKPASLFQKVKATNQAGNIAMAYEKFSANDYADIKQRSIGYGTKAIDGEHYITEQEARRRMFADMEKRHRIMLNNYPAYKAANPNIQGALLDTFYTVGTNLEEHSPIVSKLMQNPANLPYIIQEIPSYRKAYDANKKEKVVLEGLARRRGDDVRLALDPNDRESFPYFVSK